MCVSDANFSMKFSRISLNLCLSAGRSTSVTGQADSLGIVQVSFGRTVLPGQWSYRLSSPNDSRFATQVGTGLVGQGSGMGVNFPFGWYFCVKTHFQQQS